jgi:hypothetical protein
LKNGEELMQLVLTLFNDKIIVAISYFYHYFKNFKPNRPIKGVRLT